MLQNWQCFPIFILYFFLTPHIIKIISTKQTHRGDAMFMIMKVPRGSIEEELALVCCDIESQPSAVYVPRLFIKLGLETIRIAEKNRNIDCGPTVGIDTVQSARSRAVADERSIAGWHDMRSALCGIVCANTNQQEQNCTGDSIDSFIPDIAGFLQRELADIDLAMLIGTFHPGIGAAGKITPENLKKLITGSNPEPEIEKLSAWVVQHEKIYNFRIYEVIAEYLNAYREGVAQIKKARGRANSRRE
jgi:hypothetical protein